MQSNRGRHEDVRFARLDFLQGADVQVRQLRKLFLSDFARHAFATQVGTKDFDVMGSLVGRWHALSCRKSPVDNTA